MNWDDTIKSLSDGQFVARPHWRESDKLFAIGWGWVSNHTGDIGLRTDSGLEVYNVTSEDTEADDWHEVP